MYGPVRTQTLYGYPHCHGNGGRGQRRGPRLRRQEIKREAQNGIRNQLTLFK